MAKVLIIDDDEPVATALEAALKKEGNEVEIATDADRGLARAKRGDFDVVLTDLHWKIPGSKRLEPKGLELTEQLHSVRPQLPVILITAIPSTETTIEATKVGAYDYFTKPKAPAEPGARELITKPKPTTEQELEELLQAVRKAAASSRAPAAPAAKEQPAAERPTLIGKSRAMQNVYKEIGRVATKPVTVLIRGETGTGKELVARALHQHGERADKPFVIVNCVAIPETLLESELFGHEQGAFTGATAQRVGRFEQANHGTIFLDEIGDITTSTQAKLLRVLQDQMIQRVGGKEPIGVDVRVVAATHRDLETAIQERKFRQDLYYRLNDAVIRLPPLRERKEDIPDLFHHFMQRYAQELGSARSTVLPEALEYLQQQTWPGNVRELKNVVHKALLLAQGYPITRDLIRGALEKTSLGIPGTGPTSPAQAEIKQTLAVYVSELLDSAERGERQDVHAALFEWAEREIYAQAIQLAEGDQTKAAKWLGVSRPTMREKLTHYDLYPTKAVEKIVLLENEDDNSTHEHEPNTVGAR